MTRYHDIKETVGEMLSSGERLFTRLLEGNSQPTPKAIVDLGKTVNQARPVQLVIEGLNHIERTDIAQLGKTAMNTPDIG